MAARKQLGNILVDAGVITVKTLERALERQKGSGKRLGTILEEMGVINEQELIEALAQQFGFQTVANFAPPLLSLGYPRTHSRRPGRPETPLPPQTERRDARRRNDRPLRQ